MAQIINRPCGEGASHGVTVTGQSIYEESSTAKHKLGERLVLPDGRVFYYAKASEALTAGKLVTAKPVLNQEDTVTVAHPAGTTQVTVTAASAITKDQFKEGYLIVDEGTDAGSIYKIKSNEAIASGETGTVTLYDGLVTAWSTSDTDITMVTNLFYNVQESNTDQIELPLGVPLIDVTSGYYFWLQTWGIAPVLQDEAFGNNAAQRLVTIGSGTAGAVEAYDAACEALVGQIVLDGAATEDAKYYPILLQCMP